MGFLCGFLWLVVGQEYRFSKRIIEKYHTTHNVLSYLLCSKGKWVVWTSPGVRGLWCVVLLCKNANERANQLWCTFLPHDTLQCKAQSCDRVSSRFAETRFAETRFAEIRVRGWCLPDSPKPVSPKPDSPKPVSPKPVSPKPDSPKLGFRVRVRV